jgi:hypothetical protein
VVVNHGVFFCACQWLYIILSYAEPVVVNHGVSCLANGCESW